MNLSLVMFCLNQQEMTQKMVDSWRSTADDWEDIDFLLIDNGSEVPASEWGLGLKNKQIIRNEVNAGVLGSMQQAYEHTTGDYILYTHNDVEMFEQGWDTKLKQTLEGINAGQPKGVGVAGFFGAKGIGVPPLYQAPYQMQQLIRVENVSNCHRMPSGHGHRPVNGEWEKVAVMDGFSLCVSRKFLNEQNGFDLNLPPHHMYDNHTCLQAIDRRYLNIVVPMDAFHHGGQTDVKENWNTPFGKSKAEIHAEAHYPYFYNYWSPEGAEERRKQGLQGLQLPFFVY